MTSFTPATAATSVTGSGQTTEIALVLGDSEADTDADGVADGAIVADGDAGEEADALDESVGEGVADPDAGAEALGAGVSSADAWADPDPVGSTEDDDAEPGAMASGVGVRSTDARRGSSDDATSSGGVTPSGASSVTVRVGVGEATDGGVVPVAGSDVAVGLGTAGVDAVLVEPVGVGVALEPSSTVDGTHRSGICAGMSQGVSAAVSTGASPLIDGSAAATGRLGSDAPAMSAPDASSAIPRRAREGIWVPRISDSTPVDAAARLQRLGNVRLHRRVQRAHDVLWPTVTANPDIPCSDIPTRISG